MTTEICDVIITHFVNPHKFWFKYYPTQTADAEIHELEAKLKQTNIYIRKPDKFVIADFVALKFVPWNKEIRCRVVEVLPYASKEIEYIVWALDYGFPILSKLQCLFPLPEDCRQKLTHIMHGGLANIIPIEKGFNLLQMHCPEKLLEKWDEHACNAMRNLLLKSTSNNIRMKHCFTDKTQHFWCDLILNYNNEQISLTNYMSYLERGKLVSQQKFIDALKKLKTLKQLPWWNLNYSENFFENRGLYSCYKTKRQTDEKQKIGNWIERTLLNLDINTEATMGGSIDFVKNCRAPISKEIKFNMSKITNEKLPAMPSGNAFNVDPLNLVDKIPNQVDTCEEVDGINDTNNKQSNLNLDNYDKMEHSIVPKQAEITKETMQNCPRTTINKNNQNSDRCNEVEQSNFPKESNIEITMEEMLNCPETLNLEQAIKKDKELATFKSTDVGILLEQMLVTSNADDCKFAKSSLSNNNAKCLPAGYDLAQLNKYNDPNHWHRKPPTAYDGISFNLSNSNPIPNEPWIELSFGLVDVKLSKNVNWSNIYAQNTSIEAADKYKSLQLFLQEVVLNLKPIKETELAMQDYYIAKYCATYQRVQLLDKSANDGTNIFNYCFFLVDLSGYFVLTTQDLNQDPCILYPTTDAVIQYTKFQAVHLTLAGIVLKPQIDIQLANLVQKKLFALTCYKNVKKWPNLKIHSYGVLLFHYGDDLENSSKPVMLNKQLIDLEFAVVDDITKSFLNIECNTLNNTLDSLDEVLW